MANPILDYQIGYRGFVFNPDKTLPGGAAPTRDDLATGGRVRRFDFSPASIRDQIEGLHLETGADLGPATREYRRVSLVMDLIGETDAKLSDREAEFMSALDIEEAVRTSPTTQGAHPIDFWTPTDIPPSGFTSPVHEILYARPHGFPVSYEQVSRGTVKMAACEWVCPDPRRYVYSPTVVTLSQAAGWTQAMPNWIAGQGVLVFPVLTITINDEEEPPLPPFPLTISDGTTSLILNAAILSMFPEGDPDVQERVITVDMGTSRITYADDGGDSIEYGGFRTSDVDTFFGIPPGGSSWTVTAADLTRIDSVVVTYRMARS